MYELHGNAVGEWSQRGTKGLALVFNRVSRPGGGRAIWSFSFSRTGTVLSWLRLLNTDAKGNLSANLMTLLPFAARGRFSRTSPRGSVSGCTPVLVGVLAFDAISIPVADMRAPATAEELLSDPAGDPPAEVTPSTVSVVALA